MIGRKILHYEIIEKLGEGGMGVVYKAEDRKLERTVAIKFLPRHIVGIKEDRARFKIEARAAAALNHPNIAQIYAIEEVDDEMFIVMEFLSGRELRAVVADGQLALLHVIDLAVQTAEGLHAAHKKSIVHRDIKTSNIIVTDEGQVKIMDFGLAKVRSGEQVTKVGTTLGTAAYTSPEQARGEPVDHRADIWSFGVVLYEMIAGQRPFQGDYDQIILYSILNTDPEPVTNLRPDVPAEIARIVEKALKKNAADRYQHIEEMLADLKAITSVPRGEKHPQQSKQKRKSPIALFLSIVVALVIGSGLYYWWNGSPESPAASQEIIQRMAVLPFTNIRDDQEFAFLGFALADQIIGSLSYLENVLVRPSSSIRQYQSHMTDPQTAGRDLNVGIILAGNFLKEGTTIRLNIELIDVESNEMIWREPIEVEYESAFTLQDIVTEKVVDRLKLQLSPTERSRMQSDVAKNSEAYEYYLRSLSYPSTNSGDLLAIDMLNQSIQLDSTYAPAFSELGYRLHRKAVYGSGKQGFESAEQACLRALSLNDELLSALWELARLYTETGRNEKAVELARKMLDINPNNAISHATLGYVYRYAGMLVESENEYDRALLIDPGNPRFRSSGHTYSSLGKYEKANQAFNLDRGSSFSLLSMGWNLIEVGEMQKGIEAMDLLLAQESEPGFYLFAGTAIKAIGLGDTAEARAAITKLDQTNPDDGEVWYFLGRFYALLGDAGNSVRSLEQGVKGGFFNYPGMLSNSRFDAIRTEPEFQRVLKMAKERHDAFRERFFPE